MRDVPLLATFPQRAAYLLGEEAAHTALSCAVELARSLSIGFAPSTRASENFGICRKSKRKFQPRLSRLASVDNIGGSTTGLRDSGVSVMCHEHELPRPTPPNSPTATR